MDFFFRSRPSNNLTQSLQLAEAVNSILRQHVKSKSFIPKDEQLEVLGMLKDALTEADRATVILIKRALGGVE